MQFGELERGVQHRPEIARANPGDQLFGFFAGAVRHPEDLDLIEIDARPEHFADVAAAGAGDAQARVGAPTRHVEDHRVDKAMRHVAADQIHHGIEGFVVGDVAHLGGEIVHVGTVEHRFRAECAQGIGLVRRAQRVGDGADHPAQLDQRRAHAAAGAGHQHALAGLHTGRGKHVITGLVGAHAHAGEFRVGQGVVVHGVELVGRHRHIFGIAAVGAVAVVVGGEIDVAARVGVDVEIEQTALADTCRRHAVAYRRHAPDHVGALDTREGERGRTADRERGHVVCILGRVQPFTRLAVGVVLGRGRDLDQHLAGGGARSGHIRIVDQLVDAAMPGQQHGRHGVG